MITLPLVHKKRQHILDLKNFSGGLNNGSASIEVEDNQSPDLLNVAFNEDGSVSKRNGTNIVGDDQGNVKILGLFSAYYGNGLAKLIMHANVGSNSKLFYRTTGNWSEATGTALANADTEFELFYDGANQMVFYTDGTTYAKYNPTGTAVVAATASPASVGGILRVYKNRMYLVGAAATSPERIYFSEIADGDLWTGTGGYFDAPSEAINTTGSAGDAVTALAVFQDRLIVFKNRSIWAWDTNRLTQITPQHGCVGKRAFAVLDNYLYFCDLDGVYRLSGNFVEKVSLNIQATWDVIPAARVQGIAMTAFQGRVYVAIAAAGASYNNALLVYYPSLPVDRQNQHPWSYWTSTTSSGADPLGFSVMTPYQSAGTSASILCGGMAGAQSIVLQAETGAADYDMSAATQTLAIMSYYKTKVFSLNARMKKLFATYKAQGAASLLNVSTSLDFDTRVVSNAFQMNIASANVYGTGVYGTATYGGLNVIIGKGNVSSKGKFLQYQIQNNSASQPWTLYRIQQDYQPQQLR